MDSFTEEQLVKRGYIKDEQGNWRKGATADAVINQECPVNEIQRGRNGLSTVRPTISQAQVEIIARASLPFDTKTDMNKLEAAFSEVLELRQKNGEIALWRYEAIKFILADRTTYTPDFFVVLPDGEMEFYETKGFMRDDANVKLKVAASMFFMFKFYLVMRKKREWKISRIGGKELIK